VPPMKPRIPNAMARTQSPTPKTNRTPGATRPRTATARHPPSTRIHRRRLRTWRSRRTISSRARPGIRRCRLAERLAICTPSSGQSAIPRLSKGGAGTLRTRSYSLPSASSQSTRPLASLSAISALTAKHSEYPLQGNQNISSGSSPNRRASKPKEPSSRRKICTFRFRSCEISSLITDRMAHPGGIARALRCMFSIIALIMMRQPHSGLCLRLLPPARLDCCDEIRDSDRPRLVRPAPADPADDDGNRRQAPQEAAPRKVQCGKRGRADPDKECKADP